MYLVLVTGGTGFIGSYVVRRLLFQGGRQGARLRVRLLVRRPEAVPASIAAKVEVVTGDIRDEPAVRHAVEGADTVLHLAALARIWSPDPREFECVNADAVGLLLREAEQARVRRLVHVSTHVRENGAGTAATAVGGIGTAATVASGLAANSAAPSPYRLSKLRAESLVREYAASGHHAVIVRPTRVYGPGPMHDANAVTRLLALFLRGRLRFRLADRDVRANYVHADDVAQGVIQAAHFGASGTAYTIGGEENVSLRHLFDLVSSIAGIRRWMLAIPPWAACAAARAWELAPRFGAHPFITRPWLCGLLRDSAADIGPARSDLGYAPRSLRVGLAQTVQWLNARSRV